MDGFLTWMSVIMAMIFMAAIWFAYLVRIVLNDEMAQERKRRRMRMRELERRRLEDRTVQRHRRY